MSHVTPPHRECPPRDRDRKQSHAVHAPVGCIQRRARWWRERKRTGRTQQSQPCEWMDEGRDARWTKEKARRTSEGIEERQQAPFHWAHNVPPSLECQARNYERGDKGRMEELVVPRNANECVFAVLIVPQQKSRMECTCHCLARQASNLGSTQCQTLVSHAYLIERAK